MKSVHKNFRRSKIFNKFVFDNMRFFSYKETENGCVLISTDGNEQEYFLITKTGDDWRLMIHDFPENHTFPQCGTIKSVVNWILNESETYKNLIKQSI